MVKELTTSVICGHQNTFIALEYDIFAVQI